MDALNLPQLFTKFEMIFPEIPSCFDGAKNTNKQKKQNKRSLKKLVLHHSRGVSEQRDMESVTNLKILLDFTVPWNKGRVVLKPTPTPYWTFPDVTRSRTYQHALHTAIIFATENSRVRTRKLASS